MHTARGTVLGQRNPQIRNHTDKDEETGTGYHVRYENQPTITVLELCHTEHRRTWSPQNTCDSISTICITSQRPTLLRMLLNKGGNNTLKNNITPLRIDSNLKLTYVTEYDRKTHCDIHTEFYE
jgi:hypothetical protein